MIKYKKMSLIVYGNGNQYRPELWHPIRNSNWNKPRGGLWTSPTDAKYGWFDWATAEHFGDLSTHFEIEYEGVTFVIDSEEDANGMPLLEVDNRDIWMKSKVDFEKMVRDGIQAIHLTSDGQWATRFCDGVCLYGWDCETVLILDNKAIHESQKCLDFQNVAREIFIDE